MNPQDETSTTHARSAHFNRIWPLLAGIFIAVLGLGYGLRYRGQTRELMNSQQVMTGTLSQLERQVQGLSERMNSLAAAQEQVAIPNKASTAGGPVGSAVQARKR